MKSALQFLAAAVVVVAALGVVAKTVCSRTTGSRQAERRAYAEYLEGDRLFDSGRYAEAAAKYANWRAWAESVGEDASETIGLIGRSLDLAGRPEEAEPLLKASIAAVANPHVCVYMAHFLARNRSVAEAIAWMDAVQVDPMERETIKGAFYTQRSEFDLALPHLVRRYSLACAGAFAFDDEHRLVLPKTSVDAELHNRIAVMLDPLEELAEASLELGNVDDALRYSTMGVSVGQVLSRGATYTNDRYMKCGSARCRIVRARIAVAKKDWPTAAEEAAFAQAVADWAFMGYEKQLAAVTNEIENRGAAK